MKTCQHCGRRLSGRQEKWCSEACRVEGYWTSRAPYLLSCLPQKEFRKAIREACEARWPKGHSTNRLKVRFGRYNPRS